MAVWDGLGQHSSSKLQSDFVYTTIVRLGILRRLCVTVRLKVNLPALFSACEGLGKGLAVGWAGASAVACFLLGWAAGWSPAGADLGWAGAAGWACWALPWLCTCLRCWIRLRWDSSNFKSLRCSSLIGLC